MKPLAGWLVAAALAGPDPSGASYRELVERYAAGERGPAVAELSRWSERDLSSELSRLRAWANMARRCGACPEREAFARFPLRAAVLLHADREELERRSRSPVDEGYPSCGTGPQGRMAQELALLALLKPEEISFVARWYLAMTLRSKADACMGDALLWAQGGLKWFPKDAPLLLARGTIYETTASWPLDAFSAPPGSPTGPILQPSHLKEALRDFERALRADPGLEEARLRRGRVQWLLGDKAGAHASFDTVLAGGRDTAVVYKARLFRGRCYEAENRLDEAEADYRAALALEPEAQSAAVALSYVTWRQGKAAESRETLEGALKLAGRRTHADPYWDYSFGRSDRAEPLFEELREEVRP